MLKILLKNLQNQNQKKANFYFKKIRFIPMGSYFSFFFS